jgi:apolipoprotein N-acyltransferase
MINRLARVLYSGQLASAAISLTAFACCAALASPRWDNPVTAWLAPLFLLYYTRMTRLRYKFLWLFIVSAILYMVTMGSIVPFPAPVLAVISLVEGLKTLVLVAADAWITKRHKSVLYAFFYPCAALTMEYLSSLGGSGVWGSAANSQYVFSWLAQLASVTGIWGISFLLYTFASLGIWTLQAWKSGYPLPKPIISFSIALTLILAGGAIRLYSRDSSEGKIVKVAGVTVPVLHFLEAVYKDYSGQNIVLNERLDLNSPQLQQTIPARIAFIESEDTVRFKTAFHSMLNIEDSLFILSERAVKRGASLICWSEGSAIVFPCQQSDLIRRGRLFAAQNRIYLLMSVAVMDSGKITAGKKFIENKTIFLSPNGEVLNIFHKNNPVPMMESSAPGDGRIPVIPTQLGRVSPSICYDADFPQEMRQLGQGGTQLLMLPSGDWSAIATHHAHMALFRAIENGCSIFRETSGGLSIAADFRGKVYNQFDYYSADTKMWLTEVKVGRTRTLYTQIGDITVYICALSMLLIILRCYLFSRRRAISTT